MEMSLNNQSFFLQPGDQDGVDDIDSGDGENFVTSGRLELETEGETDLETLQDHIKSHKDIFDDDDWI